LLKKHRLLQAIARTNRPYGDVKAVGLIVDYVGILQNINLALKNYYREDVKTGIVDISQALSEFDETIENLARIFAGFEYRIERGILLKALDLLRDEEIKDGFVENYKKARKLFEVLGAFPDKLKYLDKFRWFSAVYEYWRKLTEPEDKKKEVERFFKRTLDIIHQNTEVQRLDKTLPTVVLDIKYLAKVQKSALTEQEKAVNILFALTRLTLVEQNRNPIYRSILDQLNELVKEWKERKINYQRLLEEENELIKVIEDNERKREKLNLSQFDYGILLILKDNLKNKREETLRKDVEEIKNLINDDLIENWQENPTLRQNIERKIREYLLRLKQVYGLSYEEFDFLHKKLISFIQAYGY